MRFPFVRYGLGLVVIVLLFSGIAMAQGVADRFPPNGDFIEVDGTRLHYAIEGQSDGPAILLLHGASSNLKDMQLAFDGSLDGYRTIYLDRPGLGWSERPSERWNPEREAAMIAAFLSAIGEDSAVVVGHSWGGAISLRLAMDHPDRVLGLVLVAPAVRAWVGDAAAYNHMTHWPLIGTLMTRVIVPTYGRTRLEDGARSAFSPDQMPDNYAEATALPLILRASAWKANAWDMSQVNTVLAEQEVRYNEIEAPAILIAGTDDTVLLTDRHSVPVSETMPNAELILIEGAGHNPHHIYTDQIVGAIEAVFQRASQ